MHRPPCWRDGQPCPNQCAADEYRRVVFNHQWLHGPWAGWRMAGARLITPSRDWIAPNTLDRLIYREQRLFQYGKRR